MKPMRKIIQSMSLALAIGGAGSVFAIEAPADAGVDWRGPDGSTALQWAVYDGDVERVQRLIADGADVNLANNYGANPMQLAAEVANVAEITSRCQR
jgi:hypothetical protein